MLASAITGLIFWRTCQQIAHITIRRRNLLSALRQSLPGCGIPGHLLAPCRDVNYFQVAESNVALSQVISVAPRLRLHHQEVFGLLPGCGIPGHQWLLSTFAVNYFQVAESKIVVSQVIAVSVCLVEPFMSESGLLPGCAVPSHRWSPVELRRRINQLWFSSYFQVALSQVICVVSYR